MMRSRSLAANRAKIGRAAAEILMGVSMRSELDEIALQHLAAMLGGDRKPGGGGHTRLAGGIPIVEGKWLLAIEESRGDKQGGGNSKPLHPVTPEQVRAMIKTANRYVIGHLRFWTSADFENRVFLIRELLEKS